MLFKFLKRYPVANRSTEAREFLKPEVVSRIKNLEFIARMIVEGFMVGLHKSPFHGFSVEFSEHRQYMPGDNIRDIDWKVYGRTDRFYIKQYEEETNLKAYLLLDVSGSMRYSSHGISKLDYARYLAAALGYLFIKQRDAVGLGLFSDRLEKFLPPRSTSGYLKFLLQTLQQVESGEKRTRVSDVLHTVAERIKRRGLIIILSEFLYEEPEAILEGIRHFRHYQHEVLVFNILDPQEIAFRFKDEVRFVDLESGEEVKTQPYFIRDAYRQLIQEFYATLQKGCREMLVDFQTLFTDEPFDVALMRYLVKRKRLY